MTITTRNLTGESPTVVDVLPSFHKITGEKLGEVPITSNDDMVAVFARARQAQQAWAKLSAKERLPYFRRLKNVVYQERHAIVELIQKENGKAALEAYSTLMPCMQAIELYSKLAVRYQNGKRVSSGFFWGAKTRIFFEPKGVIGYIIPWNFPFELGFKHLMPALAFGNAIVQKPSELNPLIGEKIVEIFKKAGFPDHLVQVVHGGPQVGEQLIDLSNAVVFIGSTKVGKRVWARGTQMLKTVVLEMGGKDAAVVLPDANLDLTARGLVQGAFFNAGQTCVGIERIYVHESIHDQLAAKMVALTKQLRMACDAPNRYEIGPVIANAQLRIYQNHLDDAVSKGAKVLIGGNFIEKNGVHFCEPTILVNCTHDMLIMKEETFGPFACLMKADSVDRLVELANDSEYGLSASVWTSDRSAGEALARRLQSGTAMVNNSIQIGGNMHSTFNGVKDSGFGFLQSEYAVLNYVHLKSVMSRMEHLVVDSWMPHSDAAYEELDLVMGMHYGDGWLFRARQALAIIKHKLKIH